MQKILFVIHSLAGGGAEKVLINLVNHMDQTRFDITVLSILGGGINAKSLASHIHYRVIFPKSFPGNSHIMKLFTPKQLHKLFIKEHYDFEISYLEGSTARLVSGCSDPETRLISWIHVEQHNMKKLAYAFRSPQEAKWCYNRFDQTVSVSEFVKNDFCKILNFTKPIKVLYNTVESEKIVREAQKPVPQISLDKSFKIVAVGTLKASKGYDRLLRIVERLKKVFDIHLYILGTGPLREKLETFVKEHDMSRDVIFLGYDMNPYKYVSKCDLFVCASHAEGFSTAATEALIVGTPVCTVNVSGMKEMLGENNEYGIVTDNSEEALYQGIKNLIEDPKLLDFYKKAAKERAKIFSTSATVNAVEEMLHEVEKRAYTKEDSLDIDYSVLIRTTGEADEKYEALLTSISQLVPKPKEVIVVLPEGYKKPRIQLGYEHFGFCKKGMVIQRMTGIDMCRTKYALVCDDDVSFSSDFVQKLYAPLKRGVGKFSIGPLYSFFPPKGVNAMICTAMGSAVPTLFHKDRYNSILRTAGYSYNRYLKEDKYYYTQSAPWTCFFAETESMRRVNMKEEIWLDSHGYSALDDQTMFYKAWLLGMNTVVVPDAQYNHLDARTSSRNNKPAMIYSLNYNRIVFWHRFIFCMQSNVLLKCWAVICFKYRQIMEYGFDFMSVVRRKLSKNDWKMSRKGSRDGWKYIKSNEYLKIPNLNEQTKKGRVKNE